MPERTGKYCVGVGFRHRVIVRKAEFIATSTSFAFLLLDHAGEQYSAVGYTRVRLLVLSVLTEAPQTVSTSPSGRSVSNFLPHTCKIWLDGE